MRKRRFFLGVATSVFSILFLIGSFSAVAQNVRVGIYQNSPKVFVDNNGKPQGIFIDIMNEISRSEGWQIEYVFGTWSENLIRLENAEIDILLDVSYSNERAQRFKLSNIFVIDDWLEAFALKDSEIKSVFSLAGKKIGVIGGSIQFGYMQQDVKDAFKIDYTTVSFPDYPSAVQSLINREIDVFVASRFFYFSHLRDKNVWPTALILRPAEVYFAFPKNSNDDFRAAIDRNMIKLKNNPKSVYYKSLNQWLGLSSKNYFPIYIQWLLSIGLALLIVQTLFAYLLRRKVNARTSELFGKNQELESLNNQLHALLSEYKLSQNELVKFQFMVDNARQEVYLVKPNGELVYVNKAVEQSLNYSLEELLVGGIKLFDPDYGQRYRSHFEDLKKGERPPFETIHYSKDGRKLIKKVKSFYLKIVEQEYVCGFAEDITELLNAEKALHESQQLFKTLAEMSPVGIFRTRADGYTTYVNPKWCQLSGLSFDDALGEGWLKAVHHDDRGVIKKGWEKRTQSRTKSEAEYRFLKPDGSIVWVLGDAIPEMAQGSITGYIGTITDITERKRAELFLKDKAFEMETQNEVYRLLNIELQKAKLKAEESDKLKTAFLTNMSHEIRTPMNAICGFARLLSRPNLDERQKQDFISIINDNSFQLLRIINDIVDISKIEAGQMTITQGKFNINESLDELFETFTPSVKTKSLDFICHKGLPNNRSHIISDENKIKLVFNNLLANAMKFTQAGTIEFGYEFAGSHIKFFVKDTGIGIPDYAFEKIFERFHQIEDATLESRRGTGLGLPISKAYIEMLDGHIWVESELNKGSTFYFTIPYKPAEEETRKIVENEVLQPDGLLGKTILIVEDDGPNLFFLTEVLKDKGAIIISSMDGLDAVEQCKQNDKIDLILMDIKLPKLNGLDATREIRKINPKVIIIAQTAYAFSIDAEKSLEAGCNAYISKPIDNFELLKTINHLISFG
jgi:PAS domain S-box-containing protein